MQAVLINTTFGAMVAALASYAGFNLTRRQVVGKLSTGVFYVAFGLLTLFMADRWVLTGRAPWSNMYESITMVVWISSALYIVLEQIYRTRVMGLMMCAMMLLGLMVASMFDSTPGKLVPALQSYWIAIHVSVLLAGYAAFSVAYGASVYYIFARAGRKTRAVRAGLSEAAFQDSLQDINVYQAFSTAAMRFGFFALIVGIFLGGVWAQEAWGRFWGWDPKETWALITWLVYLFGLHVKYTPGRLGIRDLNHFHAWLAVIGFAFVVFTYFAVNIFIAGLHSYAVAGEETIDWSKAGLFGLANIAVVVVPALAYLRPKLAGGSHDTPAPQAG